MCDSTLGEHHPNYGTCLYNLAGLYLVTEHADKALPLFQEAVAVDDENLGQVFAVGSESQRANFLAGVHIHLDGFLSAVVEHLASSAEAIRTGMELLLRRKGIGAEALAVQRDAVLGGRYPELEPKLRELSDLRMQIARKTLAGPQGLMALHQQLLHEWTVRKERLETELALEIPEMHLRPTFEAASLRDVALALPETAVLVELWGYDVCNFHRASRGERQWQPARYLAFVLTTGQRANVQMIDLGEAEPIDQMIAEFRAGITTPPWKRRDREQKAKSGFVSGVL